MLTQQPSATASSQPRSTEDLIAYFEGDYVPLRDAKVSIMTHAFMYGTATFEGIRAYWNEEQGVLSHLELRVDEKHARKFKARLLKLIKEFEKDSGEKTTKDEERFRLTLAFYPLGPRKGKS